VTAEGCEVTNYFDIVLAAAPSTESLVVSIICDRSGSFYASLTWSIVLFVVYLPGAHVAAPILAKLESLPNVFMYKTSIKAKSGGLTSL